MTIIAFDGKTLAADKRGENCGFARTVTKIRRFSNGAIGGCTGDAHDGVALMEWYEAGADPAELPDRQKGDKDVVTTLVIITAKGQILNYHGGAHPLHIEDSFAAFGCGRDYAIAAMHLGKTACEAVEIASLFDLGCGNGIDTLTLES